MTDDTPTIVDAAREFLRAYNVVRDTPIVDDDFPRLLHICDAKAKLLECAFAAAAAAI